MPATRSMHSNSLDERYKAVFFTKWDIESALAARVVVEEDITTKTIRTSQLVAGVASAPKKTEGADISRFSAQQGYDTLITPDTYAMGFCITEEMFEDDLHAQADKYPMVLAGLHANTLNTAVFNVFNNAFDSSLQALDTNTGALCATSQALSGSSSVGQNRLSTDADLSETSLEGCIELLVKTVNEDNVYIGGRPSKLVVSASNWGAARRRTRSPTTTEQLTGKSGNAINAVVDAYGMEAPVVSPYLTDADAWFILGETSPITLVWRVRPQIKRMGQDSDNGNYYMDVRTRWAVEPTDWRNIVGTEGA